MGEKGVAPEDETGRLKTLGMWVEGPPFQLFREPTAEGSSEP